MNVGIEGYGIYIPRTRITVESIAAVWGQDPNVLSKGLLVKEKAVADSDEDTVTIAVEASRNAVARAGIDPTRIGAVFVGSESHPYAVKPSGTIVAEAVGATPDLTSADYQFACKAGTAAIQTCMGMVGSGLIEYGLGGGADTAQGAPGDPLEYTAASGGAMYVIGKTNKNSIAKFIGTHSYTTDTPDFWRRENVPYPRHGFRFTGKPAYFNHIVSATQGLFADLDVGPKDFEYAVFHQPNGKFPRNVAKMLGFTTDQIAPGILVGEIGNTYSGASILGLAAVLDVAKPGDRILVTSFGSGAGSDAFSIEVLDGIEKKRGLAPTVRSYIDNKEYVSYGMYTKNRGKLLMMED